MSLVTSDRAERHPVLRVLGNTMPTFVRQLPNGQCLKCFEIHRHVSKRCFNVTIKMIRSTYAFAVFTNKIVCGKSSKITVLVVITTAD